LILLNSDFMEQQSIAMASRVLREAGAEPAEQIAAAYKIALGREPTAHEMQVALSFLERETVRWQDMSKVHPELVRPTDEKPGSRILGWTAFGGNWTLREDGGCQVEAAPGAKMIQ